MTCPTSPISTGSTRGCQREGQDRLLFPAAGIVDPQPLAETTEESFDKLFAVNTRGLAFTVKKALPLLNDGGAIILFTSIAESKGIPGCAAYSATKAAVGSFVRTWTAEFKDRRIRVNAICPGPIDTPIFEQQAPTKEGADRARAQFAAAVPFGRLGRPEEIASTALFLASDEQLHCRRGPPSRWRHDRDLSCQPPSAMEARSTPVSQKQTSKPWTEKRLLNY